MDPQTQAGVSKPANPLQADPDARGVWIILMVAVVFLVVAGKVFNR